MSLRAIVRALGGDLYQNGRRANVPAPGHSSADRSISLLLEGDRVVVHSFGAASWREVLDDLRRRGLIDSVGACLHSSGDTGPETARPDQPVRLATARTLWDGGVSTGPQGLVARHLLGRGILWDPGIEDLLEHPAAALSVYRSGGRIRRAMMAAIRNPNGAISAVELTYLSANGAQATGLLVPRKTVGQVPPGSAVRLRASASEMVVAEGVATTLSAMTRFERPGWALLSAGNLARWRAPEGVADVLIAADRGPAGETAAETLFASLSACGVHAAIVLPAAPWGDWNEVREAKSTGEKEGRRGAPEERGLASPPAGD